MAGVDINGDNAAGLENWANAMHDLGNKKVALPAMLVASVWLGISLAVAGYRATTAVVLTTVVFGLPGIPIGLRLLGLEWRHRKLAPIVGLLSGIVMSAAINAGIGFALGWRPEVQRRKLATTRRLR